MSCAATLEAQGLDIATLDTSSVAELLQWHSTAVTMPDADITVLVWVATDGEQTFYTGWWDGDAWRDCASGGVFVGTVTHWAEPEGPAQ